MNDTGRDYNQKGQYIHIKNLTDKISDLTN